MKKIFSLIALLLLFACGNQKMAYRQLQKQNYTNIALMPYWDCVCSLDDNYLTGFKATQNTDTVKGFIYKPKKYKPNFKIVLDAKVH